MDERELREIFLERLHIELHLFRDTMLRRRKTDIYISSYMIEIYINLYEILAEHAAQMEEPLLRELLYQPSGILDAFYQEWLTRNDNFYTELQDYVKDELNVISDSRMYRERENGHGEKYHEAA